MAEEKRGANCDPDKAKLPLRRDGLVRKMKGGRGGLGGGRRGGE